MKFFTYVAVISCSLMLVGCSNIFEGKTCGIKNSQWANLPDQQKLDIEKFHHEKQRLADQMRLNKLTAKHQRKLAKAHKLAQNKQKNRIKQEANEIKRLQSKIEKSLQKSLE